MAYFLCAQPQGKWSCCKHPKYTEIMGSQRNHYEKTSNLAWMPDHRRNTGRQIEGQTSNQTRIKNDRWILNKAKVTWGRHSPKGKTMDPQPNFWNQTLQLNGERAGSKFDHP